MGQAAGSVPWGRSSHSADRAGHPAHLRARRIPRVSLGPSANAGASLQTGPEPCQHGEGLGGLQAPCLPQASALPSLAVSEGSLPRFPK